MTALPKGSTTIVEAVGAENALKLVVEFGGTRLDVPKNMHAEHRLAQLIGLSSASQLVEAFGGESIHVPRGADRLRRIRNALIRQAHAAGTSTAKLARLHHTTQRHIFRILAADDGGPTPQMDLFAVPKSEGV